MRCCLNNCAVGRAIYKLARKVDYGSTVLYSEGWHFETSFQVEMSIK